MARGDRRQLTLSLPEPPKAMARDREKEKRTVQNSGEEGEKKVTSLGEVREQRRKEENAGYYRKIIKLARHFRQDTNA